MSSLIDSLTLNSWPAPPQLMPEAYLAHTFLHQAHPQPLPLRNKQHFRVMHRGHIKQQNYQNSKEHLKNCVTKQISERTLAETREGIALLSFSWEHVYRSTQIRCCSDISVNDHESTNNIDFGVTNKFLQVSKFVNT